MILKNSHTNTEKNKTLGSGGEVSKKANEKQKKHAWKEEESDM